MFSHYVFILITNFIFYTIFYFLIANAILDAKSYEGTAVPRTVGLFEHQAPLCLSVEAIVRMA